MDTTIKPRLLFVCLTMLSASALLGACGKHDESPTVMTDTTSQPTVPPPPGDSTPKAADSSTRSAAEGTDKTGTSGPQSTVGTAAAGAPPYTINGAPEGNQAPGTGTGAAQPVKQ